MTQSTTPSIVFSTSSTSSSSFVLPSLAHTTSVDAYDMAIHRQTQLEPLTHPQVEHVISQLGTRYPNDEEINRVRNNTNRVPASITDDVKVGYENEAKGFREDRPGLASRLQILSMNDELERLLGYSRAEYVITYS
jgi:hypothetical protein